MLKKWRIGIVIPWFGKDLKGGAEQQAWQMSKRLHNGGCEVNVLTTCSKSFLSPWHKNHYKPGIYFESGLKVKRFSVENRKVKDFNRVVGKMLALPQSSFNIGTSPLSHEEESIYWNENINSSSLIHYLKEQEDHYDFFIFLPYLFPSSVKGISTVSEKSLLQVCLHDECYAYLPRTVDAVSKCKGLLFNSEGEFKLAKKIYGDWIKKKSYVIGEGIELEQLKNHDAKKDHLSLPDHYVLALGRRCKEKNTDLLIEAFEYYKKLYPSKLKLILAGPGELECKDLHEDVIDLGLLDEQSKRQTLLSCRALINVSVNESYSRVLFEAWSVSKPVIVHRNCLATYTALEKSDWAGWAGDDVKSIAERLNELCITTDQEIKNKGENGRKYAKKLSDWDQVVKNYESCFSQIYSEKHAANEENKKILYVYPYAQLDYESLNDFIYTSHILLQEGWHVFLLAKCMEDIRSLISNKIKLIENFDQLDCYPIEFVIWQGSVTWKKAEEKISFRPYVKIFRDISPHNFTAKFISQFSMTLGARFSDSVNSSSIEGDDFKWLPPILTYEELQKKNIKIERSGAASEIKDFHLIAYLDIENYESRNYFIALCNYFYEKYKISLNIDLRIQPHSQESLKYLKPFLGKHINLISNPNLFNPSRRIKTDDDICLLIIGDPVDKYRDILASLCHSLPTICVNSKYWSSYLNVSYDFVNSTPDFNKIVDLMHDIWKIKIGDHCDTVLRRQNIEDFIPGKLSEKFLEHIDSCKKYKTNEICRRPEY